MTEATEHKIFNTEKQLWVIMLCWWAEKIVGDHGQWVAYSPTVTVDFTLSVSQFSRSVVSDSLQPHGLQHTRPPCPSPTPGDESNESALRIRWPKYWNFNFSLGPSNEYLRLIFFRIDWFDFLEVQGTLKTSPAPVWRHQFFGTQLFLLSSSHICTWLLEKS